MLTYIKILLSQLIKGERHCIFKILLQVPVLLENVSVLHGTKEKNTQFTR